MAKPPQTEVAMRLVIDRPVPGVWHSLQDKKSKPLPAQVSKAGESLVFDFPIRIGPGPKYFGEQVRSEGPVRRFVYIAVGTQAGEHFSAWSRRMKIDIHDIAQVLLEGAMAGRTLVGTIDGTARDGTPACATVPVERWFLD